MKFEIITAQSNRQVSREEFLKTLSKAIKNGYRFYTRYSVDGYTMKKKKSWVSIGLGIMLVAYYDSDKEIEDL